MAAPRGRTLSLGLHFHLSPPVLEVAQNTHLSEPLVSQKQAQPRGMRVPSFGTQSRQHTGAGLGPARAPPGSEESGFAVVVLFILSGRAD